MYSYKLEFHLKSLTDTDAGNLWSQYSLSAKTHLRSCFSLTVLTRIRNGTISSMFLFFLAFDTPYCRKCFTFSLLNIKVLPFLFDKDEEMHGHRNIYKLCIQPFWVVRYMALKVMHILHNTFCECIFTDAIYLYV